MNIIICDDHPVFTTELKQMLSAYFSDMDWPISCETYTSAHDVLDLDLSMVHAAFLDIDMPVMNGLELASILRRQYPQLIIIFVTSYIEYAPAGYRVDAFRYLLKTNLEKDLPTILDELWQKLYFSQESVSLRSTNGTVFTPIKNIVYLEGTPSRHTLVHLLNPRNSLTCIGKLTEYEEMLLCKGFLRIQRSFVVNMQHISRISGYQVVLRSGEQLRATEKNYTQLCGAFLQWKGAQL
ncbi:MAG: LytTR family DNA-binding domain-containing protein [Clostridia bacterium]